MGTAGQLPKGFPEGMVISFTQIELESLKKNPVLMECFEQIKVVDEYPLKKSDNLQTLKV